MAIVVGAVIGRRRARRRPGSPVTAGAESAAATAATNTVGAAATAATNTVGAAADAETAKRSKRPADPARLGWDDLSETERADFERALRDLGL